MPEPFGRGTAENLITLLAHDPANGKLVAQLVKPEHFDNADHRLIVERCMTYWEAHKAPPGVHLGDLFPEILERGDSRKRIAFTRMLAQTHQLFDGINADWTLAQAHKHIQQYTMKAAIIAAADKLQSELPDEAAEVLDRYLHQRVVTFDPGITLADFRHALKRLHNGSAEFDTGIGVLDRANIVPERGTLLTLIGDKGAGKSWFLISLGKRGLFYRRRKVLHITLENSAALTLQRYFQAICAVPKHHAQQVPTVHFLRDEFGRNTGENTVVGEWWPAFSFDHANLAVQLKREVDRWGARLNHLVIKQFAEASLTMGQLRAFLDLLEQGKGFVPDLLLIDYPRKMKLDPKNLRIELGQIYSELRALAVDRNMAVVAVHQGNREGSEAKSMKVTHAGEDWSVAQTSDTVLLLSRGKEEKLRQLARITVDKARNEQDGFAVAITQNYTIGQFAIDSVPMFADYEAFVGESKKTVT